MKSVREIRYSTRALAAGGATMLLGIAALGSLPAPGGTLRYNRDIRPILAENCFPCHGPDSAARKAGLRLDRFVDATADRGGRRAIVPGDPVASELVRRISKAAGDPQHMPPVSGHKDLTPLQKQTLLRWIAQGAAYEVHWSYIPPKRPALPAVKNAKWVKNPIDRFVLAKLEASGLSPAPEADRRTLARRVALDLTGLPPEPADVERFVSDRAPNAYEKFVDSCLASVRWGEHRGRYWLDAARYGDTHGIHIDNFREIWAYRDWVIDAFNRNLPFDQFTIEQLAGDLLPKPTLDQRIATGFTRCNITTSEGGAIDEEYRVLYTRDRTETAAQVWLGTTAGCAVCHDHKFDPLSQKEFYSLSAFFNNTTQAAMDGNIKDTPPILFVPSRDDRPRWDSLQTDLDSARKAVAERRAAARPDFSKWIASADPGKIGGNVPQSSLHFHAVLAEGKGREIGAVIDGAKVVALANAEPGWDAGGIAAKAFVRKNSAVLFPTVGDFEKDQTFTSAAWVKLPAGAGGAIAARMDEGSDYRGWDLWVEGNRIGTHIISKWPENALKVVSREPVEAGKWHHVAVTYDGSASAKGVQIYIDGVRKDGDATADALKGSIKTATPFKIGQRSNGAGIEGAGIQDVRLYGRALSATEVMQLVQGTRANYLASLLKSGDASQNEELFTWWLSNEDAPSKQLVGRVREREAEEQALRMRGTIAHVAQERPEEPIAHVLFRGDYDKRRDAVKPATPAVLPAWPADFPKNRLGLAKWLLLPNHPLTSRVTVNRFWQELFGTGLVKSSGDFGISGELPSHPELLDWLALDFQRDWNIKRVYKQIVLSATYRQAAVATAEKKAKDPGNRLLSHGPRFRMDAEMLRDYALCASGLLSQKIGGASVRPYQPDGVWEAVAMIGSDTRNYKRDSGESLYRRSMYTFWKRSAPPASMEIFNAPSRETCTVRRERTNTPLQALVTLNDVQFVEAARTLAQRALRTEVDPLDGIARRVLARPLAPVERIIVEFSLADLEAYYQQHPKDAQALITEGESKPDPRLAPERLAAWTMLTNQMLNLDEALNK